MNVAEEFGGFMFFDSRHLEARGIIQSHSTHPRIEIQDHVIQTMALNTLRNVHPNAFIYQTNPRSETATCIFSPAGIFFVSP